MDPPMYSSQYQRDPEGPPPYHPSAIKQWANRVVSYSSQYNSSGWSAEQALGAPRVYPQHGDIHGAWASGVIDRNQFIELEFEVQVTPTGISIYETFNPGAIVSIKCKDATGRWEELWSNNRPTCLTSSRIFSPQLKNTRTKTNQVRIEVDCSVAHTWCEIDAVQLIGIRDGAVAPVDDTGFFDDLKKMVNNKTFSDIKFELDGKNLYAHKVILSARSAFFRKMLKKNPDQNKVDMKLPNISHEDLKSILEFIYTNRLPTDLSVKCLTSLCKAAETLEMAELKTAAMYKVIEVMTCENVTEVFQIVQDDRSLEDLQHVCVTFMADHIKHMSNQPSFEALPRSIIVKVVQQATAKLCVDS